MTGLEWNALRRGDRVLVHHPPRAPREPVHGTVVMVTRRPLWNEVGIDVGSEGGPSAVDWPSHRSVHRDPPDADDACWRCDELAGDDGSNGGA